jgi:hypothetical protein
MRPPRRIDALGIVNLALVLGIGISLVTGDVT